MGYKFGKAGFSDNLKYIVGRNVQYVQLNQNITDEQSIIKTMFKMDTINVVVMRNIAVNSSEARAQKARKMIEGMIY